MRTSRSRLQHVLGLICSVTLALPAMATITLVPYPEAYVCKNSSISVSAETDCEAGGLSLSSSSGTLVLTGGGSARSGTYSSGSTPRDVLLSASDDCDDSVSSIIHVMEVLHQCVAATPVDQSRGEIGVGEQVFLGLGGPSVNASWSTSAGSLSEENPPTLTAPETAGSATVTATFPDGNSCSYTFTVVAPTGVHFINSSGDKHRYARTSAGFLAGVVVNPTTVSFGGIQTKEDGVRATDKSGAYVNTKDHDPGSWVGVSDDNSVGADDQVMTDAGIGAVPGGYTYAIPWRYRLKGSAGEGIPFTTANQVFSADSTGTATQKKGAASTAAIPLYADDTDWPF